MYTSIDYVLIYIVGYAILMYKLHLSIVGETLLQENEQGKLQYKYHATYYTKAY